MNLLLFLKTILALEIGLVTDNDIYFHTDQYYTGSVAVYAKAKNITLAYKIDCYTPNRQNYQYFLPPATAHPYAGYGYFFAQYDFLAKNSINHSLRLELGFTGEKSNAHRLQEYIHTTFEYVIYNGWNTQLHEQFITQFNYELSPTIKVNFLHISPIYEMYVGNLMFKNSLGAKVFSEFEYKHLKFSLFVKEINSYYFYNQILGESLTKAQFNISYGTEILFYGIGVRYSQIHQSKTFIYGDNIHSYANLTLFYKF